MLRWQLLIHSEDVAFIRRNARFLIIAKKIVDAYVVVKLSTLCKYTIAFWAWKIAAISCLSQFHVFTDIATALSIKPFQDQFSQMFRFLQSLFSCFATNHAKNEYLIYDMSGVIPARLFELLRVQGSLWRWGSNRQVPHRNFSRYLPPPSPRETAERSPIAANNKCIFSRPKHRANTICK